MESERSLHTSSVAHGAKAWYEFERTWVQLCGDERSVDGDGGIDKTVSDRGAFRRTKTSPLSTHNW